MIPMLPKLKPQAMNPNQAGTWITNDNSFLKKLVNGLELDNTLSDIYNIDAIPDVWARPLIFKMALFDADAFGKDLHNQVVGEWRAILAMLALQNIIKNFNPQAKTLNLQAESVDLTNDNSDTAKVFKTLAPRESFDNNLNAWITDIYVIYYGGKPLAMTSPVTLVAAVADYSSNLDGILRKPWSNDGKILIDPVKNLTRKNLMALKVWLENLQNNLNLNKKAQKSNIANKLSDCLKKYIDDVDDAIGNFPAITYEIESSNLKFATATARLLNDAVRAPTFTINDSAVHLITDSKRSTKQILLLSPSMLDQLKTAIGNIDLSKLIVWQGISAVNINKAALQNGNNKLGDVYLPSDVEIWRPADFFCSKMAVVKRKDSFPGALSNINGIKIFSNEGLTPILPFKRELLEYFTPDDIISRTAFSIDNDNIIVNFKFPLSGVNNRNIEYTFSKKYLKKDLIVFGEDVPVIEIWPNICRSGWKKYYLYYENSQAQSSQNADVIVNETYYIEPFTYGKTLDNDFPRHGLKNSFTAKIDHFPEALILNNKSSDHSPAKAIGCILLNKPPIVNNQGLHWKIGLDFGTSATILYFIDNNNSRPAPLNFKPRLFNVSESVGLRTQTFINFIASQQPKRIDGSFLSIFHSLNGHNLNKIRPLQDGNILSFVRQDIFKKIGNMVDTNLKWNSEMNGRQKVAIYIRQVCLQALVEAAAAGVEQIQWNFSYPTSFSMTQRITFENTCYDSVDFAYTDTGFTFDKKNIGMWTESKASAYYFNHASKNHHFMDDALCVDIGAGTTDITVIDGNPGKIIYHTSVQYAGRQMFKFIYDNYGMFVPKTTLDKIQWNNQEQRQALIDADMRENSDQYIKGLNTKAGNANVAEVLLKTQFAVAGLFYYLGKLLNIFRQINYYKKNIPEIYIGGNGARIFHWITLGSGNMDSPLLDFLNKMLSTTLKPRNVNITPNLSRNPKSEVVTGMIVPQQNNNNEFFNMAQINETLFGDYGQDVFVYNSVFAGAEFAHHNANHEDYFISAYELTEGISIDNLNAIQNFIKCFNQSQNRWANKDIKLSKNNEKNIISEVNGIYVGSKDKPKEDIFVEPVFIVELKRLLERL